MALGASSFSPVSTGFTKDSKAMIPVSIQGVGGQVQKMSSFETMQEIFFDIRDGIESLSDVFSEKISGLNEHLAFRFESLNSTLLGIAGMTDEQLDIDKKTGKIIRDNEKEDERDESLNKGDKKFNGAEFLKSMQERFNSFLDFLAPKSEIAKVGLLGALTLGIFALLPKLEKSLEGVFKFTGEKLIPFLDSIFDIKDDETGEFKWDRVLGVGLLAYLTAKSLPVIGMFALKKLFTVPGGLKVAGLVGLATWATASIFQTIGDWAAAKDWSADVGATDNQTLNQISGALAGDLKGGIMNSFKNASKFAGAGAFTGFMIGGPPGALIGGVIGAAVGGILGWIGGGQLAQSAESLINGVKGIWNSVTTGIRNFFYDYEVADGPAGQTRTERSAMGKVIDRFKADFKLMGEGLKDFFYDDEGNLFGINFGALIDMLPSLKDIADKIVKSLPKWMRPDTLQEKIDDKRLSIEKREDELARSESGENVYFGLEKPEQKRQRKIIAKEKAELLELENEMKTIFPGIETTTTSMGPPSIANGNGTIVASDGGSMALKTIEFKSLINSKESEDSGSTSMIVSPTSITKDSGNTTMIDSHVSTGSLSVDAKDPAARKLDAFMAAAAG